jgi:hypothetical protein
MFGLRSSNLDFSLSGNISFQLSGFTTANGSFSRNKAARITKTNTPQNTDPFAFTKLYAHKVSGNLNLTIDLSDIVVMPGYNSTTLTPKGFFVFPEYDANASGGVIVFRKATTDGYTGCYNLDTNVYKLGLNYPPLLLLGEVGSAPTTDNKLLNVQTVLGNEPRDTYVIIWGD